MTASSEAEPNKFRRAKPERERNTLDFLEAAP